MPRKDRNITPSVTAVLQSLGYNVADWDDSKSKLTDDVKKVLSKSSKKKTGREGYPDRVYCDKKNKLLILVEEKPTMKEHDLEDINKGAISGIKWYLSRFQENNLENCLKAIFKSWRILGIAVSGDLLKEYQYKFSCFMLDTKEQKIVPVPQITNFVNKDSFLAIFNNLNEEEAVSKISSSSKKINNLLRSIDSQKRPILLSALMICLHNKNASSFSDNYSTMDAMTLADNILIQASRVLKDEGIPSEKLDVLDTELAFLKTDVTLRTSDILKQILDELKNNVIPLLTGHFAKSSNYDIIGKFYEEFLKYAGVSNVKKGIVLTPRHITTLFTKLIDLKENDKIVDLCCGTGAFLIAGMNALVDKIEKSNRGDKEDAIANVKQTQLLGFEINPTMYICAISSMMFRGDGKSSIYNYDSIKDNRAQDKLKEFKATIGFINPPYSGKENKEDPTPKEITFLTKLLDNCSRYGIIIAPLSMYFKDEAIRDNILKKHTLKAVINMPKDLFQPNASTHTAIAIFETNKAFNYDRDEVIFYDLRDDGFVLAKNKGRTDIYNRWNKIEAKLLSIIKEKDNTEKTDDVIYVKTKIRPKDEWTIYAHSKTDYSSLSEQDFINTVRDYMIFEAKKDMGILFDDKSESEMLDILSAYYKEGDNE